MKVTYIYHSCFIVELGNVIFVFDYFKGELPLFDEKKEVIFFASHKHQDHFSLEILKYAQQYKNVRYVLSNDIKLSPNYLINHGINPAVKEKIISIGKNKSEQILIQDEVLNIDTLRSTDQGVAFLIEYDGKSIYHAGDLNWWSWEGETKEEYEEMTTGYVQEIDKLQDKHVDCAFVVLDPRQGDRFWWGFHYFMRTVDVDLVFPMHCWEDYSVIERLLEKEISVLYRNKIKLITEEGQIFHI
ncbi:MAG: MBL fold metallo-hydrolase [bacterium]|nr:MBL fold metallo-hydrolase [bacterium]